MQNSLARKMFSLRMSRERRHPEYVMQLDVPGEYPEKELPVDPLACVA
jgi:hypothetical protein